MDIELNQREKKQKVKLALWILLALLQPVEAQVHFVDVSALMGIDFVHHSGISAEKRLPETDGSGAAFLDYDGDGQLDLYLVNSGDLQAGRGQNHNRLYRNEIERFVDVTRAADAKGLAYGMGVLAGDVDNDGDPDLYLTNWGPDQLLLNGGAASFADGTEAAGLANPEWGSSAAYIDYDNDGDLDLYIARYVHFDLADHPWCGRADMKLRFYCDPRQYQPSVDMLWRNEGNGTFVEVSQEAGIVQKGNGLGVVCGDYDSDGDADIYVANDLSPNFHFDNRGDGTFAEIGLLAGTAFSASGTPQAGMGVDAADYDNDGDLDLFVTNFQLENNTLYRNEGAFFDEVSFDAGIGEVSLNYLGFGTGFFDADNDGWSDLLVVNGHVHDNIEAYDQLVTYAQQAQLFRNEAGAFVEATGQMGPGFEPRYVGRGSAFGDYDGDGDLDIALTQSSGPTALLRNEGGNANHWLGVQLVGRQSNRAGVGAKVRLQTGKLHLFQEVKLGSGYQSTSQKGLHFGLGGAAKVERLEVHWPSGAVQVFVDLAADQVFEVVEAQNETR